MSLTLHYFRIHARAEPIKMILAYGKVPYVNQIIEAAEWPTKKGDTSLCPLGQLPALKLKDGRSLVESAAIIHYVAKLAGVYPSNPEDAAFAHVLQEMSGELNIINPIVNFFPNESEKQVTEKTAFFETLFPRFGNCAVQQLSNQAFFGGSTPHFGDFCFFHICDLISLVSPDYLTSKYPALAAWAERVRQLPAISEYLSERSSQTAGFPGSYLATISVK